MIDSRWPVVRRLSCPGCFPGQRHRAGLCIGGGVQRAQQSYRCPEHASPAARLRGVTDHRELGSPSGKPTPVGGLVEQRQSVRADVEIPPVSLSVVSVFLIVAIRQRRPAVEAILAFAAPEGKMGNAGRK